MKKYKVKRTKTHCKKIFCSFKQHNVFVQLTRKVYGHNRINKQLYILREIMYEIFGLI